MGLIRRTPVPVLRAAGRAWRLMRRRTAGRCLILMYHDIVDGAGSDLFARQMEFLSSVAAVVPLDDLLRVACVGPDRGIWCAITFDDGYEGVYRDAFPHLLKHGFAAMVYLSTSFIAESANRADGTGRSGLIEGRPLLSWCQAREMERCGVQFGSHMAEHGDLSRLRRRAAMEQLHRSRGEISSRLGKPCEHFAYPFGRFSAHAANWVREAGFRTAATTVHLPLLPADDPFRLPRVGIYDRYSLRDFKSIICGDWDFIGLLQTLRRPALRMRARTTPADPRSPAG